ncbi:MAG TPA: FtsK/SpoIIIE domain-containing protein, partial [Intrasporangium sp.]|uniref:FtsK/SpoIIIE domain-containing protein n=1 Tax=Intrasporangium sp. TaxID=1925024 RepID=UPI002D797391
DDGADDSELAAVVSAVQEAAVAAGVHAGPAPWLPPLPHRLGLPGLTDRSTSGRATVPATSIPVGLADLPALQQQDVFTWDPDASGHLGIAGGPRSGRTSALTTLALGIAERYGPHQVHIHILEGVPGALSDLAGLPHVGSVTGASDPARARRAVDRLCQQLDRSAEDVSRLTVVLVDGWEAVQDSLDRLDHGATTDRLVRLMRDGLSSGLRVVVTGGRALTGGRLVPLVQQRLVLPLPDPLDLALVGLDRAAAPTPWPPGRAVHATTGLEIQLAYAGAPAGKTVTPLMQSARSAEERWSWLPPEVLPWRLRELPTRVTLREVPSRPPPHLAIGVGEEEGSSLGFDPSRGERRILVAGGRRTGRSTALHALAMRLLEQHHPLIVVTVRPSCLTAGAARTCSGVVAAGDQPIAGTRLHLLGPGEVDHFVELRRAVPQTAIIVDDAESLDGSPMADALAEAARLVETAGGVIAAAVDVARQPVAFRGLVAEVARDSTGLLLCPTATSDGDLFRLAAEAVTHRIPGRGLHILARQVTPIHIADAA